MSQFNGTWKTILEARKGFDEFMTTLGLPAAMIDAFREVLTVLIYEVDGDTWKVTAAMENLKDKSQSDTIKPKTYTVKLGQELCDTDLTGKPFKMTCTLDADGTLNERNSSEMTGWREIISKRWVTGDKMIQTQELSVEGGKTVSWTEEFKKV